MTLLAKGKLLAFSILRVPELIVVVPVYVLSPVKIMFPGPVNVKGPEPLIFASCVTVVAVSSTAIVPPRPVTIIGCCDMNDDVPKGTSSVPSFSVSVEVGEPKLLVPVKIALAPFVNDMPPVKLLLGLERISVPLPILLTDPVPVMNAEKV